MEVKKINKDDKLVITYQKLFYLFIVGSILGVLIEGLFCYFKFDHFEYHVVSVWGPFCILYGIGSVICYVCFALFHHKSIIFQFLIYTLIGFTLELICGLLLEFGLSMRAWNYTNHFMNFRGHVSLSMTVIWGFVGIAFAALIPYIEVVFKKMKSNFWHILCILFTIFMIVNLTITGFAIVRWKDRHFNRPASNKIEQVLDKRYDNQFMEKRFCEWRFLK